MTPARAIATLVATELGHLHTSGEPNLKEVAEALGVDRPLLTRHCLPRGEGSGVGVGSANLARYMDAASEVLGRPVMLSRDGAGGWVAT